jgi:hypothetical protein
VMHVRKQVGGQTHPAPPVVIDRDRAQCWKLCFQFRQQKVALRGLTNRRFGDPPAAAELKCVRPEGVSSNTRDCECPSVRAGSRNHWQLFQQPSSDA